MQSVWIWLLSITVSVLFFLGVPIFLVIGFWVIGASVIIDFTLANLGVTLFEGLNFYGLLALPLFILTGDLIKGAGIAKRLSDFAYSCLGWLRGGLALAALGSCGLFAAISGSNSATTATIGSIMHPEMTKGGYDKNFSAATCAAGGTVGIIIPPSIIFIVYGFLMNLSISDLFIGGILPGAMMVAGMMIVCWGICQSNGWGHLIRIEAVRIIKTGIGAWIGFGVIILVIWGIYSGRFSPTEAAAVTAGVCTIVGLLFYPVYQHLNSSRTASAKLIAENEAAALSGDSTTDIGVGYLAAEEYSERTGYFERLVIPGFSPKQLPDLIMRSGQITGVLAPLIAISIVMQQILSLLGAKAAITHMMSGLAAIIRCCSPAWRWCWSPARSSRACQIRSSSRRFWRRSLQPQALTRSTLP